MVRLKLKADARKLTGRKVKQLRRDGIIPANIYGKKVKSTSVGVEIHEFSKVFKEAGETTLVDLLVGKDTRSVLVRNVQVHPVDGSILHVDFQEVNLKEKVEAQVPVELVGESPAEKQGLGTVVQQLNEITVSALPTEIPEKFEVKIDKLTEVDQAIHVKDLKVDKDKVEIAEGDLEKIIVKVEPLAAEEIIEPVAPVEGEVPAEGAAAPAEGEGDAAKEGAEKTEETSKE